MKGDLANTNKEKGVVLEKLICYLFSKIPGITVDSMDKKNAFGTDEYDLLILNSFGNGLSFLTSSFIIECKNFSTPVGSRDVDDFRAVLKSRGCDYGILVAASGISGSNNPPSESYVKISEALHEYVHILVIVRHDIEIMKNTNDMVKLLQKRYSGLKRTGTCTL